MYQKIKLNIFTLFLLTFLISSLKLPAQSKLQAIDLRNWNKDQVLKYMIDEHNSYSVIIEMNSQKNDSIIRNWGSEIKRITCFDLSKLLIIISDYNNKEQNDSNIATFHIYHNLFLCHTFTYSGSKSPQIKYSYPNLNSNILDLTNGVFNISTYIIRGLCSCSKCSIYSELNSKDKRLMIYLIEDSLAHFKPLSVYRKFISEINTDLNKIETMEKETESNIKEGESLIRKSKSLEIKSDNHTRIQLAIERRKIEIQQDKNHKLLDRQKDLKKKLLMEKENYTANIESIMELNSLKKLIYNENFKINNSNYSLNNNYLELIRSFENKLKTTPNKM